jgi:hypothetical protein
MRQRRIGICLCVYLTLAAAGCGTHGPVSNGGLSQSAAVSGNYGALSSNKKFQTGAVTLLNPHMKPVKRLAGIGGASGPIK